MTARLRAIRDDTETLDAVPSGTPAGSIRTNAAKTARVFGDEGIWLALIFGDMASVETPLKHTDWTYFASLKGMVCSTSF